VVHAFADGCAAAGRFTSVKLRSKRPECVACGTRDVRLITPANLPEYDYVRFTGICGVV
jgi:adenylyltransferase and sulfurtransferase